MNGEEREDDHRDRTATARDDGAGHRPDHQHLLCHRGDGRHRAGELPAVNAITPGYIATDMLATIPEKMMDTFRSKLPVGRTGRPEEIARVVAFLADGESPYITGQIWAVNGGLDM